MSRIVTALALLSVWAVAHSASTLSRSEIWVCAMTDPSMTVQSKVVNGGLPNYRARVLSEHMKKNNGAWEKIDVAKTSWSPSIGNAVVTHQHDPGLFKNADDLRMVSEHFYQRCGNGFWEEWREEHTDQTGCGEDTP